MATSGVKSRTNQRKLEDYRAYQEEMLKISREYSQARLAVWTDEARALHDTWSNFTQEWQSNLEQMTALAGGKFEEMAARGEASAGLVAQSWQKKPGGRLRGRGAVGRRLPPDHGAGSGGLGVERGEPWGRPARLVVPLGRSPGFRRLVSPGRGGGGPPGDGDFPGNLDG